MDKVEWEIVRADIAMAKARLKANGEWAKWEEFQTQTNRMAPPMLRRRLGVGCLPSDAQRRPRWLRSHRESR